MHTDMTQRKIQVYKKIMVDDTIRRTKLYISKCLNPSENVYKSAIVKKYLADLAHARTWAADGRLWISIRFPQPFISRFKKSYETNIYGGLVGQIH